MYLGLDTQELDGGERHGSCDNVGKVEYAASHTF